VVGIKKEFKGVGKAVPKNMAEIKDFKILWIKYPLK